MRLEVYDEDDHIATVGAEGEVEFHDKDVGEERSREIERQAAAATAKRTLPVQDHNRSPDEFEDGGFVSPPETHRRPDLETRFATLETRIGGIAEVIQTKRVNEKPEDGAN